VDESADTPGIETAPICHAAVRAPSF